MKIFTILADNRGAVWLEGSYTDLEVRQMMRDYERRGVYLSDYYSREELAGNS